MYHKESSHDTIDVAVFFCHPCTVKKKGTQNWQIRQVFANYPRWWVSSINALAKEVCTFGVLRLALDIELSSRVMECIISCNLLWVKYSLLSRYWYCFCSLLIIQVALFVMWKIKLFFMCVKSSQVESTVGKSCKWFWKEKKYLNEQVWKKKLLLPLFLLNV